ncbi:MAG: HD domain-containing protein [Patescibacteria group bacterium]
MLRLGALDKVRALLDAPRGRTIFMAHVARIYSPLDWRYLLIHKAYNDGKDACRNEEDREGGERKFEHWRMVGLLVMVYLRITSHIKICAGILHDMPEDIKQWSIERVIREFGMEIAVLLDLLNNKSMPEGLSKAEQLAIYHRRAELAPREFWEIKLCDRLHNLLTLDACPIEKIRRKIEETERYYLPYAEKHFILVHEIEAAIAELRVNFLSPKTEADEIPNGC